jgi:polysaccharide export outer membrane protein
MIKVFLMIECGVAKMESKVESFIYYIKLIMVVLIIGLFANPIIADDAETYQIGVDDVISINVWKNPDLSVEVPVRPDGMVSMPLIGDVRAGGMTPEDVATNIQNRLRIYIRDPRVSVIVTDLVSHEFLSRIRVTGAVVEPTSIPYRQGMTVLDVVLEAGGITEFASANGTRLYRKENGKTSIYKIRLKDILKKGKLESNISLQPGDVITIPESVF